MTTEAELIGEIDKWLPKIPGWCSPAKAAMLAKVILTTRPQLCVEIGVFGGSSLIPQAMALRFVGTGVIHGIDPWARDAALEEMVAAEHREWWGKVDLDTIMRHCQHFVRHIGLGAQVQLFRAKAEDVAGKYADGSIDLLHVDGNHSEAVAYRDATLWLPKVRSGGHVFFDDIHWAEGRPGEEPKPTTRKALLYLLERCRRVDVVGDCMVLQRM